MADLPRTSTGMSASLDDPDSNADASAVTGASSTPTREDRGSERLQVVEERVSVGKRRRPTGSVRVGTRTEVVDAVAEVDLDRYRIEVTRVPVGRAVDAAPAARTEGDTTIIPVVEERLVLVKQLVVVEEVRIRHVVERGTTHEPVVLRRQRAVVERLDADGRSGPRDAASPD